MSESYPKSGASQAEQNDAMGSLNVVLLNWCGIGKEFNCYGKLKNTNPQTIHNMNHAQCSH